MAALEILLLVGAFTLYLVLKSINRFFGVSFIFILFLFAYIVSNREFSIFYLILFLIVEVIDLALNQISEPVSDRFRAGKFTFKGFHFIMIGLVFGLVIYMLIAAISTRAGGNIVGVPNLGITSTSEIAQKFQLTFQSMLGIIENRFVFVIFDLLVLFGAMVPFIGLAFNLLPIVLPMAMAGLILGIFHVAAYSVSVGLIIWASLAFMMFIGSRMILKDSLAADTAHVLNNAAVSVTRGLQIVV